MEPTWNFNDARAVFDEVTGIKSRDTTACAFYGNSAEIPLSPDSFMYLEEARNDVEELVGFKLSFCLIGENLPDELPPDKKEKIEKYFEKVPNWNKSIDWWAKAQIGNPYRRDTPTYEKRLQSDKKSLWVDLRTLEKDIEEIRPYIPKFKETCEKFSYNKL